MVSVPQEDNRYFSFNLILVSRGARNTTDVSNQDTNNQHKTGISNRDTTHTVRDFFLKKVGLKK